MLGSEPQRTARPCSGGEGRAEKSLWELWCFPALLGGQGVCGLCKLEAVLASTPGHGASGADGACVLAEGSASASSSPGC